MPLSRRLPKHGFHNPFRTVYEVVNIGSLERFDAGSIVDPETLLQSGLARRKDRPIKILATGTLTKALTIKAHAFSRQARETIVALGGATEVA